MKTPNYLIRIPEPCHEDWKAMQPDAKGKFCGSCSKAVIDFSNKTDTEIRDILIEYKEQKVCGHFKKSQVNRPLNITVNLNNLPQNVSSTRVFAIAVFLIFGTFLFSCTTNEGKKIGEIELVNRVEEDYTLGKIMVPQVTDTIIKKDPIITSPAFCPSEIMGDVVFAGVMPQEDTLQEVMTGEIEPQILGGITYVMVEEDTTAAVQDTALIKMPEKINDQVISNKKSPDLLVYPNPGSGGFTLKYNVLKRANVRVDIFDMDGVWIKNVVNDQYAGCYQVPVDLSSLPVGIYLVNMINAGERFTQKLVIEK